MIEYKEFRNHMVHDNIDDFMQYCGDNIEVIDYMPIGKKYGLIDIFAMGFTYTIEDMLNDHVSTFADILMEYELRKLFNIFFAYTNIEFDYEYRNSMEYDLIHQSYFYTYVMQFCHDDYVSFCNELDVVVGIKDMSIINTFNKKLNVTTVEDVKEMEKIINSLDVEKLKAVSDIIQMNDPLTKQVGDIIRKDAQNNTVDKLKEQRKFEVVDGGKKTIRDSET